MAFACAVGSQRARRLQNGAAGRAQTLTKRGKQIESNMKKYFVLGILFATLAVSAQQVPPQFFGMNLHPKVLPGRQQIAWPASLGAIRLWGTETSWADLNPSAGTYNFTELDSWFAIAAQHDQTQLLFTFGAVPTWASSKPTDGSCTDNLGSCDPPKDLNVDGTGTDLLWQNFVTAVVTHAEGRIHYWEIWNEPDVSTGTRVEWTGTYAQTVRMAKDAYAIIKKIDPTAQVLTPCPVDAGNGHSIGSWMPGYVKAGGLQYADIASFHGYISPRLGQAPEAEANKVQAMKSALGSKQMPIWDSEGAWGDDSAFPDPDMQAAYTARMYLMQWSSGVQRFYWFQWGNTVLGTLLNGTVTKAGTAYSEVYGWMVGQRLQKPCTSLGTVWTCTFVNTSGVTSLVVWNASPTMACHNGRCPGSLFAYPSGYSSYQTLAGGTSKLSGGKVLIGTEPILLTR